MKNNIFMNHDTVDKASHLREGNILNHKDTQNIDTSISIWILGRRDSIVFQRHRASCVCGRSDAANFRPCRFLSEGGGGVGGGVIMLIYSKARTLRKL